MSTVDLATKVAEDVRETGVVTPKRSKNKVASRPDSGQWRWTILVLVIALIVLVPVFATIILSLSPQSQSTTQGGLTLENFTYIFSKTEVLLWVRNSLVVTLATVVVSVAIAAPAGYVLSRGRSRAVAGYSLILFVAQSLPVVVSVVPLFILFAKLHLVDNLFGLAIVYISATMSVATWMMAAYFDTIPIALEEAAWIDGSSVFGSFIRIVLRNSLPGVLSTAIFAFLLSWNDYLVAIVFMRTDANYTLPVGLQTFFADNSTSWGYVMAVSVVMMLPPIIIFAFLNRYFSVGGIGGSLAGR
jgi:multiple sugar transport system permease protein